MTSPARGPGCECDCSEWALSSSRAAQPLEASPWTTQRSACRFELSCLVLVPEIAGGVPASNYRIRFHGSLLQESKELLCAEAHNGLLFLLGSKLSGDFCNFHRDQSDQAGGAGGCDQLLGLTRAHILHPVNLKCG